MNNKPKSSKPTVRSELNQLKTSTETNLDRLDSIRKAFYGVADNLPRLMDELELADLELGGKAGPLLDEHYIVSEMMDLFKKLKVGRYV